MRSCFIGEEERSRITGNATWKACRQWCLRGKLALARKEQTAGLEQRLALLVAGTAVSEQRQAVMGLLLELATRQDGESLHDEVTAILFLLHSIVAALCGRDLDALPAAQSSLALLLAPLLCTAQWRSMLPECTEVRGYTCLSLPSC